MVESCTVLYLVGSLGAGDTNASVLECAVEPKHSETQGTLNSPLSDDDTRRFLHHRKLLLLLEKNPQKQPANSWVSGQGKYTV